MADNLSLLSILVSAEGDIKKEFELTLQMLYLDLYYPFLTESEFNKSYFKTHSSELNHLLRKHFKPDTDNFNIDSDDIGVGSLLELLGFLCEQLEYSYAVNKIDAFFPELCKKYNHHPLIYLEWGDLYKAPHSLFHLERNELYLIYKIRKKYFQALKYAKDDLIIGEVNLKIGFNIFFEILYIKNEKLREKKMHHTFKRYLAPYLNRDSEQETRKFYDLIFNSLYKNHD